MLSDLGAIILVMVNEDFLISYWTLAFSNALWVLSKTSAVDPVPYKAEFAPCMYELLPQQISFFMWLVEASIALHSHCPLLTVIPPSFFPAWKCEANFCGSLSSVYNASFCCSSFTKLSITLENNCENAFSFLMQFLILEAKHFLGLLV